MKILSIIVFCLTGVSVMAQDPQAVSASQAEAVRQFPALGQRDSEFNKRFLQQYAALKASGDPILTTANWPEVLAKQTGAALGVAPITSNVASAPTASTKASGSVADGGTTQSDFRSDDSQLGGFLGMPWGTPPDKAKALMLARDGTTFDTAESNDTSLSFYGGTFSGYPLKGVMLIFCDGGLCEADVLFAESVADDPTFADLETALEKKYSTPFTYSTDNHLAEWYWPKPNDDDYTHADAKEALTLFMGSSFSLSYKNVPLAAKAEEIRKQKLGTKDL